MEVSKKIDLRKIQRELEEFIVKEANAVILKDFSKIKTQFHNDGVDVTTNFDRQIESDFADFFLKKYPAFGFVGEENYHKEEEKKDYQFLIDPIDGSKYFAKNIPLWSSTVALLYKKEPLVGVIYFPVARQLFSASAGNGSFLNNKKLKFDGITIKNFSKMIISLDFVPFVDGKKNYCEKLLRFQKVLTKKFYRVRTLGLGALSIAWLTQNYFQAYVNPIRPKSKFIDLAAGICIAKEAGATVSVEKVEDFDQIIIGSKFVVKEIKKLFDNC